MLSRHRCSSVERRPSFRIREVDPYQTLIVKSQVGLLLSSAALVPYTENSDFVFLLLESNKIS